MAEYDITFLRIDYVADHLYNVDKRAVFHAQCGDVRHGFNNDACVRVQPLIAQLIEVHQLELCHGGRQFRILNRTAAYKIDDLQGTAVCQQAQKACCPGQVKRYQLFEVLNVKESHVRFFTKREVCDAIVGISFAFAAEHQFLDTDQRSEVFCLCTVDVDSAQITQRLDLRCTDDIDRAR